MTLIIIGILVYSLIKKGTYSKRSLYLYSTLTIIAILIYAVETIKNLQFTSLPILYIISDFMIALNYDHSRMHDITLLVSELQNTEGTIGYAAFDRLRNYLGCNKKIYEFIPELSLQNIDENLPEDSELANVFYRLMDNYILTGENSLLFNSDDITCQCEISEFNIRNNDLAGGYLFQVRDVTENQRILNITKDYNKTLNIEVAQKTAHIKLIQEKLVLGLANMIENRDDNTGGHVKRTSDIIRIIVQEVKNQGIYDINDQFIDDVIRAAPMHDLGKITIENSILRKPDKLTKEEYDTMKMHSVKSGEFVSIILNDVEEEHFVRIAFNIARYHHEHWDGRGYPEGLVGEMIPLEARIMAIADVYDALASKRSYKEAFDLNRVSKIMLDGMGSHFDPQMESVFIACLPELEAYYMNIKTF
ncbi:MAG: HD domain-containing protein [Lachnospiraceae bacterium]|nr:HD domain-containing protein [Lachnospiraceae bacterium]